MTNQFELERYHFTDKEKDYVLRSNCEYLLKNKQFHEQNRLMGVSDFSENFPIAASAYVYNAGGERVWKLSGDVQQMTINGTYTINMANITDKTLYTSPYLVANNNNYTKHYFVDDVRVCSKIGGGFDSNVDPIGANQVEPIQGDLSSISNDFTQHVLTSILCTGIENPEMNTEPILGGIEEMIGQDEYENSRYFFTTDHLGSSSFITDAGGDAVQHLQYMPPDSYRDGEHFVNQTSTSWETPYKFSGKEKDAETGYRYFGARYYDSELSVWLSVDPMSDKLPFITSYSYCYNHPVKYNDPD